MESTHFAAETPLLEKERSMATHFGVTRPLLTAFSVLGLAATSLGWMYGHAQQSEQIKTLQVQQDLLSTVLNGGTVICIGGAGHSAQDGNTEIYGADSLVDKGPEGTSKAARKLALDIRAKRCSLQMASPP